MDIKVQQLLGNADKFSEPPVFKKDDKNIIPDNQQQDFRTETDDVIKLPEITTNQEKTPSENYILPDEEHPDNPPSSEPEDIKPCKKNSLFGQVKTRQQIANINSNQSKKSSVSFGSVAIALMGITLATRLF